jgi:Fe-S cluster assembly ATP-binding protein
MTDEGLGALVITHYNRLLEELRPDVIHILVKGRIVASGGPELADQLERDGYAAFSDDADDEAGSGSGAGSGSSLDDLFRL